MQKLPFSTQFQCVFATGLNDRCITWLKIVIVCKTLLHLHCCHRPFQIFRKATVLHFLRNYTNYFNLISSTGAEVNAWTCCIVELWMSLSYLRLVNNIDNLLSSIRPCVHRCLCRFSTQFNLSIVFLRQQMCKRSRYVNSLKFILTFFF